VWQVFEQGGLPVADIAMCCSYKLADNQQFKAFLSASTRPPACPGDMYVLGGPLPHCGDLSGVALVPAYVLAQLHGAWLCASTCIPNFAASG
jgi:hypothetical protein